MLVIAPENSPGAPLLGTEGIEDDGRPDEAVLVEPEFPEESPEVSSEPGAPVSLAEELSVPEVAEAASETGSVDPLTMISEPELGNDSVLPPTVTAGPPGIRVVDP
jgi:hypothetical protein